MRLVAWNILHGGGHRRMAQIAVELVERRPDVIILNEFRATMGGQLQAILRDHGLVHQTLGADPKGKNVVLLAARQELRVQPAPTEIADRVVEVSLPELALTVLAVHVPDESSPTRRRLAWQHICGRAAVLASEKCVISGDFNTGRHKADEEGTSFTCTEYLGKLASAGYVDAFRTLHGATREETWVPHVTRKSLQKGQLRGVRIDGAFVSSALASRIAEAEYCHAVRTQRVSDHSIFTLKMEIPSEPVERKSEKTRENSAKGATCDLIAPLFMV